MNGCMNETKRPPCQGSLSLQTCLPPISDSPLRDSAPEFATAASELVVCVKQTGLVATKALLAFGLVFGLELDSHQ